MDSTTRFQCPGCGRWYETDGELVELAEPECDGALFPDEPCDECGAGPEDTDE